MIKISLNGIREVDADREFIGYIRLNIDDKVYLDSIKIYKDERQDNGIAIVAPANKSGDKYFPFYKITSKAFTEMLRDCVIRNYMNPDNKEFVFNADKDEKIGLYVYPDTNKVDMLISGKLCVDSFRIMQNKENGELFISMPSIKRMDPDGKPQYDRVVTISKGYKEEFNKEILDKYNKYSKDKTVKEEKPEDATLKAQVI